MQHKCANHEFPFLYRTNERIADVRAYRFSLSYVQDRYIHAYIRSVPRWHEQVEVLGAVARVYCISPLLLNLP